MKPKPTLAQYVVIGAVIFALAAIAGGVALLNWIFS